MLIRFTFKNFRSFYGETVFSMRANADTRYRELNTTETRYGWLNKSAFVFGANGGGKSNFIGAINYMKNTVLAEPGLQSGMIANADIFMFSENSKETPSVFEAEFLVGGARYEYGFELLNGAVSREYLYIKTKRKTPLFIRPGLDSEDITVSENMDDIKDLVQNTQRNALILSLANESNNVTAMAIFRWFRNMKIFDTGDTRRLLSATIEYLENNEDERNNVLKLLQQADVNIVGFDFAIRSGEEQKNDLGMAPKKSFAKRVLPVRTVSLNTKHHVYNENWELAGTVSTSLNLESAGTRKLFEIAGPVITTLESGGVMFIDEIDSRLHPMLVRSIIMMFNSTVNNQKGAQLICCTNDALLLDEDIRRDQVYFTEKDERGVSKLYSLTDFKGVRKESKHLKQYLLGALGAAPKLRDYFAERKI